MDVNDVFSYYIFFILFSPSYVFYNLNMNIIFQDHSGLRVKELGTKWKIISGFLLTMKLTLLSPFGLMFRGFFVLSFYLKSGLLGSVKVKVKSVTSKTIMLMCFLIVNTVLVPIPSIFIGTIFSNRFLSDYCSQIFTWTWNLSYEHTELIYFSPFQITQISW